jgi:hypothetical protein
MLPRVCGNPEPESAPFSNGRFNVNRAAMLFDNGTRNGESQSGSFFANRVPAVYLFERLENLFAKFFWNAWSPISDTAC